MKKYLSTAVLILILLVGHTMAHAANKNETSDEWEFLLAPLFLWGMSIEGTSTIGPVTAPLNLNFKDDILENMDSVFTIHFEARKGKWTILTEYQTVDLKPTATGPGNIPLDISFENDMFELAGTYQISQSNTTRWELLAGVRNTAQKLSGSVSGGPALPIAVDEDWWDVILGGRVFVDLSKRWTFAGRADYGFGDSDSVVNLALLFDYRFNNWGSVFVGGRYMDYDFETGSGINRYAYKAEQRGPLLGLAFHW